MPTRTRVLRRAAALFACAATLTACGLLPGTDDGNRPEVERNTLRIGVMPVVDVAPLKLAINEKLFEKAGLSVQHVTLSSEAEGIKQLDTTLDITWASHVNLFRTVAEGTQLQLQGEAYQAGTNTMALVTTDPNYDGPAKLDSPRIAVNSESDVGALTTKAVLDTAGVEKQRISLREMPFERMVDAMRAKEVDAAWMTEPFITKAQKDVGARIVTDTATGPTKDFPMSGYASSKKFADANPKTLALFRQVLRDAQQLATNNKLSVQDVLTGYVDVDQQTAALVSVGTFPLSLNPIRLQRVADMMDNEDVLPGRLDVQGLLPPGTTS
ncbi:NitT/TauT family transport system substrate-binding protein [Saccharothrix tamanrassetensis]|uniref:NitT/TauT family transport system substrate-binding protein n=1 Tax=Saccharothrix tamanrassetensis TaxID=1051531 RepID=A0A841CHT0_9PSEU|nr:ABC transporter substrate-binding protein [Saccharothrix tamanrassetensis]MBB5956550.1 NitT/TauT family transport system substrate-binding protein [Saccharothrix tamanrassetensis]